jgi:hypothetical protein
VDDSNTRQHTDDDDPKPRLSFKELLLIILSGHLGVRKREQRVNDFGRANGLHVFVAAVLYFVLVVTGLIVLVNYITR